MKRSLSLLAASALATAPLAVSAQTVVQVTPSVEAPVVTLSSTESIDTVPDLAVMKRCGLAVAPPNAVDAVKRAAHLVTRAGGGRGAVRELCERLLAAQGRADLVSGETAA